MSARKIILGLVVCLLPGILAQQVLSQGTGSGGFSGGSSSIRPRNIRPSRIPGQPDFERMKNMGHEERVKYFRQLVEEQRKAREKAKRQWITAQQQLREVLDFRQQARLVLMGFLD